MALLVQALVPGLGATLVAVVLGLAMALGPTPPGARLRPGLTLASRRVLRVGVALLGLQLMLGDVLALGWPVLLVVLLVVGGGIAGTLALARVLRVPDDLALLVACGFSICGAAAVGAVDGVRGERADRARDTGTAVALVVLLGSVSMVVLPLLARLAGLDEVAAGAWAGASVQEVGQVVVAGGLLGSAALPVALAVKLARVVLLAPVLAVLTARQRLDRSSVADDDAARRPPLLPGFVAVFLALALTRTLLDVPAGVLHASGTVQTLALAAGMFALGTGLDREALRRAGRRPMLLAALATGWVTLLALPAVVLA